MKTKMEKQRVETFLVIAGERVNEPLMTGKYHQNGMGVMTEYRYTVLFESAE